MAADVVISYSSKDSELAQNLYRQLHECGIHCWIAPNDIPPGQEYLKAITEALNAAQVLVLVFSSNVNQSRYVPLEVERAYSKGLAIIPYRVQNVAPSPALDLIVSAMQWFDGTNGSVAEHATGIAAEIRIRLRSGHKGVPTAIDQIFPAKGAAFRNRFRTSRYNFFLFGGTGIFIAVVLWKVAFPEFIVRPSTVSATTNRDYYKKLEKIPTSTLVARTRTNNEIPTSTLVAETRTNNEIPTLLDRGIDFRTNMAVRYALALVKAKKVGEENQYMKLLNTIKHEYNGVPSEVVLHALNALEAANRVADAKDVSELYQSMQKEEK